MFESLKRIAIALESIAADISAMRKEQERILEISKSSVERSELYANNLMGQFTKLLTGGNHHGQ